MSKTPCPVCSNQDAKELPSAKTGDFNFCECPRCGEFSVTGTAVSAWRCSGPTARQVANASSWIREHQSIRITSNDIQSLLSLEPPTVAERADRLLIEIAHRFPDIGTIFQLEYHDPKLLAVSWSTSQEELVFLLSAYLTEAVGCLRDHGVSACMMGTITPTGYAHLNEIRHSRVVSNIGFCAMRFDPMVKPVWIDAIEPAIRDAGYDPKRIDTHEHNNRIDDEIMAMIRRSKFVVADFTGQRGGVYFEAGFALGLGLPVVWTCSTEALNDVHFDNRQYSFVTWQHDKLSEFKTKLQNRIEATIGRGALA